MNNKKKALTNKQKMAIIKKEKPYKRKNGMIEVEPGVWIKSI